MAENPTRALSRVQEPMSEPLTLAEAKLYLRVDGSDDDEVISLMISAVRDAAEEYLRRSLVSQQWRLTYEDYAPLLTPLPRGPVLAVEAVKRRTRAGTETVVSPDLYHVNARHNAVHFESIVMSHEVEITYTTGYGEEDEVPASIRQGMLVHLAELYDNRAGCTSLPAASICLYKPHREVRI